jgi:hypothetical protein
MGEQSGRVLVAPLMVVDEEGRRVLEIATDEDGGTLTLFNRAGTPAIHFKAGGFLVLNGEGEPVVTAGPSRRGGTVGVRDPRSEAHATLTVTEQGASVAVTDATGKVQAAIDATADCGQVSVTGPEGCRGAILDATAEGGRLGLFDPDGPPLKLTPREGGRR